MKTIELTLIDFTPLVLPAADIVTVSATWKGASVTYKSDGGLKIQDVRETPIRIKSMLNS